MKNLFASALLITSIAVSASARTWTNKEGKQIQADLISVEGDPGSEIAKLRTRMPGGRVYEVPLANLSEADQEFAKTTLAEKPAPAEEKPEATAEENPEARQALVGTWKGRVEDGQTGHELTFTLDTVSGTKDGKQNLGAGTIAIDQSEEPWRLDAVRTEGGRKGQVNLGIYSLEGNTLKWCVDSSGKERPSKFATSGANYLLVLQRVK